MSVERAKGYYLNKYGAGKLNCSQAVIAAFRGRFFLDKDVVASFALHGRGMAPDGICGALYAAQFLLKDKYQDRVKDCEDNFIANAGSAKCREIRKLRKLPCIGCVEKSAEFVEKIHGKEDAACNIEPNDQDIKCARGISMEGQVRLIAGIMIVSGIAMAWLAHWSFIVIPLFAGFGLIYAGLTDNCLMGILLMKLPHNRTRS
jgi:hypothetical protein